MESKRVNYPEGIEIARSMDYEGTEVRISAALEKARRMGEAACSDGRCDFYTNYSASGHDQRDPDFISLGCSSRSCDSSKPSLAAAVLTAELAIIAAKAIAGKALFDAQFK
jgi:hypothetical protein